VPFVQELQGKLGELLPLFCCHDPSSDLDWPLCHCAIAQATHFDKRRRLLLKIMKIKNSQRYLISLNVFVTTRTGQCCSL